MRSCVFRRTNSLRARKVQDQLHQRTNTTNISSAHEEIIILMLLVLLVLLVLVVLVVLVLSLVTSRLAAVESPGSRSSSVVRKTRTRPKRKLCWDGLRPCWQAVAGLPAGGREAGVAKSLLRKRKVHQTNLLKFCYDLLSSRMEAASVGRKLP